MQLGSFLTNENWMRQLEPSQHELVQLSLSLWDQETQIKSEWVDYSFVVFPMAKAYEGFLKSYFLHQGLITESVYRSRRFRIGRALNPDIRPEYRNGEWLYDELEQRCSPQTAQLLWDTWLSCRNQIFHYFPDKVNYLSLKQAEHSLAMILAAMSTALACDRRSK